VIPSESPSDSLRCLDWLAFGNLANAILTGLAAVAIALNPIFRQSERMATLGAFLALACVLLATLDAWTGLCLRQRRGRAFCLTVSALNCLCFPGVLVGLATLAILARPTVARAFTSPQES
jgi:hypothetical protein